MLNFAENTKAILRLKGSLTCHIITCLRFSHPENLLTPARIESATLGLRGGHVTSKPPSRQRNLMHIFSFPESALFRKHRGEVNLELLTKRNRRTIINGLRGLELTPCREGTIHSQTSIPSLGFEPWAYGTVVSVTNHYTGWAIDIIYKWVNVALGSYTRAICNGRRNFEPKSRNEDGT
ncbi:hypothetical protein TNCV_4953641 [Trichonephila clavipes]|nr:hypothetical protein TNCV_4953641 [Trichonephila clavipes]